MQNFTGKTVILADGDFPRRGLALRALETAARVICCDAAVSKLLRHGGRPHAIVGDFDSIAPEIKRRHADLLVHDASQEYNDLTKAFRYCLEQGWRDIVVLGISGTREDHSIGNISLLADFAHQAPDIVAITEGGIIFPLLEARDLPTRIGQPVSIFSLDPRRPVTVRGLEWPVENLPLESWWRATLNRAIAEKISIEPAGAPLLVFLAHSEEEEGVAGTGLPVVLTVAGSDSGGNAGIQADLRAFNALDVHGCTAITALTAQNPDGVYAVQLATPDFMREQLRAILTCYDVKALKTGMLASAELVEVVAGEIARYPQVKMVIDPVMVATSGAKLLVDEAVAIMREKLLPLAALITPNLPEAEMLADTVIVGEKQIETAARTLVERYGCNVIIKGGHSKEVPARDFLCIREDGALKGWWLASMAVENPVSTHGTGCTLSAAIAAHLALGYDLLESVARGKAFVLESIRTGRRVGIGVTATVLGRPRVVPRELIEITPVDAGWNR
jgi:hydroxymethylpyrimidine/phosphomethylpyrimidine kinase